MRETLSDFLVDLATSPDRMQAFLSNPSAFLDRSALSADEKAAVVARDGAAIRRAIGLAPGSGSQDWDRKPTTKKKPVTRKKPGSSKKTGTKKK